MSISLKEAVQTAIKLAEGETYLGGRVLLSGSLELSVIVGVNDERLPQDGQRKWAKSLGGMLMNRYEGLVIYNEHRALVKEAAYWTDDECEWDSSCAWCQGFYYGTQGNSHKSAALRGVAVRRFTHSAI